ncbi:MAG: alpha/beta hydrolase, partial [Eubacteriales bacterium]|nr:alpha/beta hydrolase [Eubacteriales bacterium]
MTFDFNGIELYYEIHGETKGAAKPILILNGIMMSTKSWQEFLEPMTQFNQIILFDFPDQGQSGKCSGDYDHKQQVHSVIALLDHLQLEQVNIYGVSYGGQIALQVALDFPARVDKLALFNTPAETSYWLYEVGQAWNNAAHDGLTYYYATIPYIYSPRFFAKNHEWMENRKKILVPLFNDEAFIGSMIRLTKSSENYNIKSRIGEIEHDTLIVGCEYDFVTPFYQQEELHAAMKNSKLIFIPNSGHGMMYEEPELFISILLGHMNNNKTEYKI